MPWTTTGARRIGAVSGMSHDLAGRRLESDDINLTEIAFVGCLGAAAPSLCRAVPTDRVRRWRRLGARCSSMPRTRSSTTPGPKVTESAACGPQGSGPSDGNRGVPAALSIEPG